MLRARTRTGRSRLGRNGSVSPTGVMRGRWSLGMGVARKGWLVFAENWRFVVFQQTTPILRYGA